MKFITNIEKEKFEEFVKNHPTKSHFLQSSLWGEFSKKEKNFTPHYVGMEKNNVLKCVALLLQKKLPLGYSYFYSPRGFVIDFNDTALLKEFTNNIKDYVKDFKTIFIKIDPDLIIKRTKINDTKSFDYDTNKIIKTLKNIGFKHLGFTQKFETTQPRFSFRIDFNQTLDDIYNNFSKTTKQRIKKAEDLDVEVTIGKKADLKEFYNLMKITENRKDFVSHDLKYYESLYDIFSKNNNCNLFLGKVDLNKIICIKNNKIKQLSSEYDCLNKIENRSKTQNNSFKEIESTLNKLNEDILKYNNLKKEHGSKITLNGHFIIEYGNTAWVLYAGNHNILTDTYANYKTYYEHIKFYYDKVKVYDQFGTVGNINTDDPLYGLHEFKKKFGGDYVEFVGEFDLITNKFMYFMFTKLIPIYRKIVKSISKKSKKGK